MRKRNRKFRLLLWAALFSLAACQQQKHKGSGKAGAGLGGSAEVLQVLQEQANCWSQGDLTCYMQGYWNSDSLMFIGRRGLTYGWQHTLANYQKSYPDTTAMGKLTFDILENKALAENTRLVIGKWMLTRRDGDQQGHFSVIFRRFPEGWKIIADHSS